MNKLKYVVMVLILLSQCSQRNLSTPTNRLIGHWMKSYATGEEVHAYYGKTSSEDRTGSCIVVDEGNIAHHNYSIASENPSGKETLITFLMNDGSKAQFTHIVSKDGLTLIRKLSRETELPIDIADTLKYVDNKIEPLRR